MGKRKAARKPQKKAKETLAKRFACLFCNHEQSIEVKINDRDKIGELECSSCGVKFQTPTHGLTAPIDVYSDWIDATEEANRQQVQSDDEYATRRDSDDDGLRETQRRRIGGPMDDDDDDY